MANFFPARAFGRGIMGSPTAKRAGGVVKIFRLRACGRALPCSLPPDRSPLPPCSLPLEIVRAVPALDLLARPSAPVPCSRRPLRSTFPPVSHFPRPSAGTPARRPCARPLTARPLDRSRPARPSRSTTGRGKGNPPDPAPVRHGVMIRADG